MLVSTPRILQRRNQKVLTLLIQNVDKQSLPENCGILHVNSNKLYFFDSQIQPDEIKQLEIPYNHENDQNSNQSEENNDDVYRLVYVDHQGIRRVFGKKILVRDWRRTARQVLQKAIQVQDILGGSAIDYVRFIKNNQCENDSAQEITERFVDEAE